MSFTVKNSVLYGVIVTRESWYIGLRLVGMKALSEAVVDKVAPANFSGELVAMIADELTALKEQTARAVWKPDFSNARSRRYASPSHFERQVFEDKLFPLGVSVVQVYDTPSDDGKKRKLFHLCAKSSKSGSRDSSAYSIQEVSYDPTQIQPAIHGAVVNPAPTLQKAQFEGLDDVEAAIQNWNAVDLEKLVKRLHLEIVAHDPAHPLKPRLQMWTRILS